MTERIPEINQPEQEWNLDPLRPFLMARSELDANAAWDEALLVINERFPSRIWGSDYNLNPYGHGAHGNLYRVECQRDFREWLKEHKVTEEAYAEAVGPVQYVSFQLHLRSLMERTRSNKGWRVRVMSFPALGVIACGLGSHYQGTQNHNQMGRASQLIRARALEMLTSESKSALEDWPAATADHWEGRGLMEEPVLNIGTLDISTYDGGSGAKLRMVRNTTVKKELSTFFAIKGMTIEAFLKNGHEHLEELRIIAGELGHRGA